MDHDRGHGSFQDPSRNPDQTSGKRGPWVDFEAMAAFWRQLGSNRQTGSQRRSRFAALLGDVPRLSPSLAAQTVETDDVAQHYPVGRVHSPRGWGSHVVRPISFHGVGWHHVSLYVRLGRVSCCCYLPIAIAAR